MARKQVYKITYPNGKIYVGMDLTGTAARDAEIGGLPTTPANGETMKP